VQQKRRKQTLAKKQKASDTKMRHLAVKAAARGKLENAIDDYC